MWAKIGDKIEGRNLLISDDNTIGPVKGRMEELMIYIGEGGSSTNTEDPTVEILSLRDASKFSQDEHKIVWVVCQQDIRITGGPHSLSLSLMVM